MENPNDAERYGYEGEMTPLKCDELKVYVAPTPDGTGLADYCLKSDVDAAIAELKDVIHELQVDLEGVKATAYAESVDANMENRRLRRALWIARARSAHNAAMMWEILSDEYLNGAQFTIDFRCVGDPDVTEFQMFRGCMDWMKIYENVERKCRAEAEEYK